MFDKSNHKQTSNGVRFFLSDDAGMHGFYEEKDAVAHAKEMSMKSPSSKVLIMEAYMLIEPRKIEFAEKKYGANGELHA